MSRKMYLLWIACLWKSAKLPAVPDQKYAKRNSIACRPKGASQKMYYYGYKLHAVCSLQGVFQSVDLTAVNVHDIHYLGDLGNQLSDCTQLGDKGYLSAEIQLNLFESSNIRLDTPKRNNQKSYKPQFSLFRKSRKRIETLFSQMCDQFMVRRNYAKSFDGFRSRILMVFNSMQNHNFRAGYTSKNTDRKEEEKQISHPNYTLCDFYIVT